MFKPTDSHAIIREELVNATDINPKDVRCPKCKTNTLILHGNSQVSHTEIREEGITVDVRYARDGRVFELETIECLMCHVRFRLKIQEVFRLEQENAALRAQLFGLGQIPIGMTGMPS